MKTLFNISFCFMLFCSSVWSQQMLTGYVMLEDSQDFGGVTIRIEGSNRFSETNKNGQFWMEVSSNTKLTLIFERKGYRTNIKEINVEELDLDIGPVILQPVSEIKSKLNTVVLTDDDLLEDGDRQDYTAGLFQGSRDEYLKAAAYNFSQTWFKLRGVDASYSSYLINGIEMNKFLNGRPQWSNWGGLNDAFKNQNNSVGLAWSDQAFGGVLGVTSMSARASDFANFKKVSLASTNRSYTGRIMATYSSGMNENGLSFVISGSGRYAKEGFLDGTPYNSWSAFAAIEKSFNSTSSINLTAFVSSNSRGKSSPNTDEVYDLRDYKYNSYWGLQNGKIRNSRMRKVMEPVLMLSYHHKSEKSDLTATVSYQFGAVENSRLGYFNAENPDPTYYKKLPSYYLSDSENPDYANAYLATEEIQRNGQINWSDMYDANHTNESSLYYLYKDLNEDSSIGLSLSYNLNLKNGKRWLSGVRFRRMNSRNFAEMEDLLGGSHFVDLNQYGEGNGIQNDLNNPDREILVGDDFQYNYDIIAQETKIFTQFESLQNKVEYFLAGEGVVSNTYRVGNYKNGSYEENSFGKSESISLTGFSFKGGVTYKYNGRNLITINGAVLTRIPPLQNLFANQRVSNKIIPNIESESILAGDVTYRYRSSEFQGRLTAYYLGFKNGIESSFFFAQGILGDEADFVHEILTGVEKLNTGLELSLSYQITDAIKIFGAGTFAQYLYTNNPNIFLESESFPLEEVNFGKVYLKNVKQGNTPQRAYSLGFEYRDNDFWWFQTNANYLSHNYLDVAPLLRTDNFYLDSDGVPFTNEDTGLPVTQTEIQELLRQEQFDSVFLVNLVGGKSWRINDSYAGFFMVVNNVLGAVFKSGGFEQGRKANYPELKKDKDLDTPLFAPKYWYGSGTSYYLNVYYRF